MASFVWLVRVLVVTRIVPGGIVAALATLAAAGATAILLDVRQATGIVAPILLLQVFATASGFRIPARRGHYDLLFTSGHNRVAIGLAHWVTSALPGVVAWAILAGTEALRGGTALTAPPVLLALLMASTVPWASTVPLPRMTGAIVLLVGVAVVAGFPTMADRVWPLPAPAAAAVAATSLASLAAALFWITRMDVPLDAAQ